MVGLAVYACKLQREELRAQWLPQKKRYSVRLGNKVSFLWEDSGNCYSFEGVLDVF